MTAMIGTVRRQVQTAPLFSAWLLALGIMVIVGLISAAEGDDDPSLLLRKVRMKRHPEAGW